MEAKDTSSQVDDAGSKDEGLAAMASTKAPEIADQAGSMAMDARGKLGELAAQGGHRLQQTAQKASHIAKEIATKAIHSAQETVQKLVPRQTGSGSCSQAPSPGVRCQGRRPTEDAIGTRDHQRSKEMLNLLWAIAAVLAVMWLLGFGFHVTTSGFIHVLLVLAIISILVRVIVGRRIA